MPRTTLNLPQETMDQLSVLADVMHQGNKTATLAELIRWEHNRRNGIQCMQPSTQDMQAGVAPIVCTDKSIHSMPKKAKRIHSMQPEPTDGIHSMQDAQPVPQDKPALSMAEKIAASRERIAKEKERRDAERRAVEAVKLGTS